MLIKSARKIPVAFPQEATLVDERNGVQVSACCFNFISSGFPYGVNDMNER